MLFKKNEQDYLLDAAGIDAVSARISEWLQKNQYSKENAIRLRFTMEEVLLKLSRHFDETLTGTLIMTRRFGTPVLRFLYEGESFDPLEAEEDEDEYRSLLLQNLGITPMELLLDAVHFDAVDHKKLAGIRRHRKQESRR